MVRSRSGTSQPRLSVAGSTGGRTILVLTIASLLASLFVVPVATVVASGNSAVQLAAAPTSGAVQLNGTSQYVTLGSASQLRSATFTVELWFKRTGAGAGTGTGNGGIASAIPLITKGRAEAETTTADVNYFFGIDATTDKLVADFEEGAGGAAPSANHPITGTTVADEQCLASRRRDVRRDDLEALSRRRPRMAA